MHFEPADFTSFTKRILKNAGIQKTVNATAPFSMGSLDITGFESQKFLNICWRYHIILNSEKSCAKKSRTVKTPFLTVGTIAQFFDIFFKILCHVSI